MDVRQLAAIVAVADHGTFSAAARSLFTVQSNVSGHVAKLERELGVVLIDRANGSLTDEGRTVVDRARRVLNEIDDISSDIASLDAEVSGDVRIGVIGTAARWLIPLLLSAVEREHPKLHPIISEGSSSAIVPAVLSGEFNAGIVHLPVDDSELLVTVMFAEDLFLLVHSAHPLADREAITLAELADVPLLLPPKGAALRRVLDRAADGANITLRAQAEIDGVRLLVSLAFDGFGAAIVPASAAPSRSREDFRRIMVPELPRGVVALIRRRRPGPSPATSAVIQLLNGANGIIRTHASEQPGVSLGPDAFTQQRHV